MLLLIEFSRPASCFITPISRFIDPYYSSRLRWSPLIVEYSNLFWSLFGSQLVMVASLQLMLYLIGHQLDILPSLKAPPNCDPVYLPLSGIGIQTHASSSISSQVVYHSSCPGPMFFNSVFEWELRTAGLLLLNIVCLNDSLASFKLV